MKTGGAHSPRRSLRKVLFSKSLVVPFAISDTLGRSLKKNNDALDEPGDEVPEKAVDETDKSADAQGRDRHPQKGRHFGSPLSAW